MRSTPRSAVILCLVATLWGPCASAPAQSDPAVSAALRTIFSPRRSPPHRTMGLSQRTFLDLVEQARGKLEVALVIDATDSMGPALESVRETLAQMMGDLELYKQNDVAYQLVVFRDVGAPSGAVAVPLNVAGNAFTSDRGAVRDAIDQVATESGAPYFPEPIDLGVHEALEGLAWSEGDDVSRWVLVFGDAPPFDPSLQEEQTGAVRKYATDTLVALATAKQIKINCVLCTTREEDQKAYSEVLDQTRGFMNALSSGTGGLMLDLSYDDIRTAMLETEAAGEVEYSPVGAITREDVERARAMLLEPASPSEAPVTLAVLPHAPLENMTFAYDNPAMQLATELRLRMKSIPGLTVVEPLLVERRFGQLRRNPNYSGLQGPAMLQALARSLGADYVVWGSVSDRQAARNAQTLVYDAATGQVVAQAQRATSDGVRPDQLGSLLAGDVLSSSIASRTHPALAGRLAAARDDASTRGAITRQISTDRAHGDLVAGLAALENALAYPAGDDQGVSLLHDARTRLEAACEADDANALAHFLLANALYNLAKQQPASGGDSAELMMAFGRALRAAHRFRTSLPDGELRTEIEADYALLVRQRPGEAIPLYAELADAPSQSDVARRANWMLAGIYGGDWGVAEEFVDAERARNRLVRILALWPESGEANFIKRVLRWDDESGGTRFPHFPQENDRLAAQVDRSA